LFLFLLLFLFDIIHISLYPLCWRATRTFTFTISLFITTFKWRIFNVSKFWYRFIRSRTRCFLEWNKSWTFSILRKRSTGCISQFTIYIWPMCIHIFKIINSRSWHFLSFYIFTKSFRTRRINDCCFTSRVFRIIISSCFI